MFHTGCDSKRLGSAFSEGTFLKSLHPIPRPPESSAAMSCFPEYKPEDRNHRNHRILLAPWPVVWWFQRQMESCLQQNDATDVQNSERGACSRPCDCRTCPCCSPGEGAGLGLVWQYAIQVPPWFLCTKQPWSEPKGSCPSFWSFSFGPGNRGQNESNFHIYEDLLSQCWKHQSNYEASKVCFFFLGSKSPLWLDTATDQKSFSYQYIYIYIYISKYKWSSGWYMAYNNIYIYIYIY